MIRREKVVESAVRVVGGITVARAIVIFDAEARRSPGIRKGVTGLSDGHERAVRQARRVDAAGQTRIAVIAELISAVQQVVEPVPFTGLRLEPPADGVNVTSAGLGKLRAGHGSGGLG